MAAENAAGIGEFLESTEPFRLKSSRRTPAPPRGPLQMADESDGLSITWLEPDSEGAAHITRYVIELAEADDSTRAERVPLPQRHSRWTQVAAVDSLTRSLRLRHLRVGRPVSIFSNTVYMYVV